jgi:hypothetical protein
MMTSALQSGQTVAARFFDQKNGRIVALVRTVNADKDEYQICEERFGTDSSGHTMRTYPSLGPPITERPPASLFNTAMADFTTLMYQLNGY